jgi:glycerophosphoryl diester phosphodiesterase
MGHETENTIASVKKALELNVDMIEIDVFLIKSGELVVFHDEILDSLTNTSGRIEDFTFEELQKVVVKGNHQIPTLHEVIETWIEKFPLNIELKGKNTAQPTFEVLKKYYQKGWKKEDFVISSFLWDELETFRKLDKEIPIAFDRRKSVGSPSNRKKIESSSYQSVVENFNKGKSPTTSQ